MAINEGFCPLKMIKCRRRQATDPQKFKKLSTVVFSFFCWWKQKQSKNNRFHIPGVYTACLKDNINEWVLFACDRMGPADESKRTKRV